MCGIIGYIGERKAQDVLLKGLSRLEYRGYDSAGVAILDGGDWREASDDERRLYYVGMTRAKENLVLCQGA